MCFWSYPQLYPLRSNMQTCWQVLGMAWGFKPVHNLPTISKNKINVFLKYVLALRLYLFFKDLLIWGNTIYKCLLNFSVQTHQKICVLLLSCSFRTCKIFQCIFLPTKDFLQMMLQGKYEDQLFQIEDKFLSIGHLKSHWGKSLWCDGSAGMILRPFW